jgi:energy-coupling factor transporter ATP-binding protein EcfA2
MPFFGEKALVPAIMTASGVTREQAKTCLYYAIATYMVPDRLERIPILAIMGPHGTGKSSLLSQLSEIVNKPKQIAAESTPTLRDKLSSCVTALIDEGDYVNEDYLIKRYDSTTGQISFKHSAKGGWSTTNINIFGATIIVRRTPFADPATTSRSIIIRTRYKEAKYQQQKFKNANAKLQEIADRIKLGEQPETTNRTGDNWVALQAIAKHLGDEEWLDYSNKEINKSLKSLKSSQNYEPDTAILLVLKERMFNLACGNQVVIPNDVLMSTIRDDLRSEFDLHLKNVQIQEICRALGFKIVSHSGYPKVKCNHERLDKLMKEREL